MLILSEFTYVQVIIASERLEVQLMHPWTECDGIISVHTNSADSHQ